MKKIAIAAMSENKIIGCEGKIPWYVPEDLSFFKMMTLGNTLLMGRKTFEKLPKLKNRKIIVISRNKLNSITGEINTTNIDWLETFGSNKLFIAGGGEIYKQFLPVCDELYLTTIKKQIDGDTHFPEFESLFTFNNRIKETELFKIEHWIKNA
jgi:dihydrofolate reductase